jgi:hypothetical protein
MRTRLPRFALLLVLPLALLTACAPPLHESLPQHTAIKTAPAKPPRPKPHPTVVALPPETELRVTATATAANGAALNLSATVLAPHDYSDSVGAPRAAATVAWCPDNVDMASVIVPEDWHFAQVDYAATPKAGSPAWPANLPILLAPWGSNTPTRAASGAAKSTEYTEGGPGDYEPECVQRVLLTTPGIGSVYLGEGPATGPDASPQWTQISYGFDFNLPNKTVDPSAVKVTDCAIQITALGHAAGLPNATWANLTSGVECVYGDPETQNDPHT